MRTRTRRLGRLLPGLVGALLASLTQAQPTTTQLPRSVRPTRYDIAITPDIEGLSFAGKVTIGLTVLEPTSTIKLNALELGLDRVRLMAGDGADDVPVSVESDNAAQTASFVFARTLPAGDYRLAIDYRGTINTQAFGLFALDYETPEGAKRALYTQFEAPDARRFVPSWDEPAYKAVFRLEATVPSGLMALGNMPIEDSEDLGGGLKRVRFAETPAMSTYLLFFGLGDFDRLAAKAGETEVGVVTQRGIAEQAQFTLDSARDILREYDDYFAIPYPLPKLDNIAAPGRSQFFSAMENWGAIFTFEHSILLNPEISTQADRQRAFGVAAHEMAHQWFGDLVTMSWWDDLWLNEGFATWMASRTTKQLHPEWKPELEEVGGRESAIGLDALATTHPVVQHVTTVEEINQAFDSITYQKGSAVIRMLENYVGDAAWREGVRQYLREHVYGNTVTDDLWRAIEAASATPVLAIAHDFTLQAGVPLLSVGEPECANGMTTLEITQGEFTEDRPDKAPGRWRVPVIARSLGSDAPVRTLVSDGTATITVPGCAPVIVNAGQSGYYRTLYSPRHFAGIEAAFAGIPSLDQLGILRDTWAQGLAGYRSAADALDLAEATPADAEPRIFGAIADIFGTINTLYRDDAARRAPFRAFALARLAPVFAKLGWVPKAGEPDAVAILREQLIGTLSALGDEDLIAEAKRRYLAAATDPSAVPGSLREAITGVVARHADGATWDRLHAAAAGEQSALVRDDLYGLLASTEDETLARRALDLALTDEPGATTSASMIGRVAGLHPDLAFDFAMDHLAAVDAKVDSSAKAGFYARLGSGSTDPGMIEKLRRYAKEHVPSGADRPIQTAVARIKLGIRRRRERLPEIDAWLERHAGLASREP